MNDATNLFTKRGIHVMYKRVIDTDSQNTVSLTSPPHEPCCDSSFTSIQEGQPPRSRTRSKKT